MIVTTQTTIMYQGTTILLLLFLCLRDVRETSGCSCLRQTTEQKIRNNNFVGIVSVEDDGQETGQYERRFRIRVIESWKGGDGFKFIKTAKDSAACGVDLTQNRYLIAASIASKVSLQMNLCGSFVKTTDLLTLDEKDSLKSIAVSGSENDT